MDRIESYEATQPTRRAIAPGAEQWLGLPIPVLDKGLVYLVDYMGNDEAIEQAARVSYGGRGTRKVQETRGLIRYLLRNTHTTPFEMVELKFHAKMPIFVARQWIRHRTASVNEMSARYSVLPDTFYVPETEVIQLQSTDNKQGRGDDADDQTRNEVQSYLRMDAHQAYEHYTEMIERGVSRELARTNLPVSIYTEWYWKIDLHNLMHFLRLRLDSHAQHEIQVFGQAMAQIVKEAFPLAWEAFEDYVLYSERFSRIEIEALSKFLKGACLRGDNDIEVIMDMLKNDFGLTNQRETEEVIDKFHLLGVL